MLALKTNPCRTVRGDLISEWITQSPFTHWSTNCNPPYFLAQVALWYFDLDSHTTSTCFEHLPGAPVEPEPTPCLNVNPWTGISHRFSTIFIQRYEPNLVTANKRLRSNGGHPVVEKEVRVVRGRQQGAQSGPAAVIVAGLLVRAVGRCLTYFYRKQVISKV